MGVPLIRCGSFRGYRSLVSDLGEDPEALLKSLNIPIEVLDNEELHISALNFSEAIELTAKKLDCPDFGLRLSCLQEIDILGPLAIVFQQYDSLKQFLVEGAVLLNSLHDQSLNISLRIGENDMLYIENKYGFISSLGESQVTLLAIGFVTRMAYKYLEPPPQIHAFYFTSPKPKDLSKFKEVLKSPCFFDQDMNGAAISQGYFSKEVTVLKPSLKREMQRYVLPHLSTMQHGFPAQVRLLIHDFLPTGDCSLEVISKSLNTTTRSIQRQLKQQDTSYQNILDNVRKDIAIQFLAQSSNRRHGKLIELAELLNYSDSTAFSRAFKGWFTETPRAYLKRVNKETTGTN